MTIKEKLQKIQLVSDQLKSLSSKLRSLAEVGLDLIKKSEDNEITMSDIQKDAFITKYSIIKAQIISKFQELP